MIGINSWSFSYMNFFNKSTQGKFTQFKFQSRRVKKRFLQDCSFSVVYAKEFKNGFRLTITADDEEYSMETLVGLDQRNKRIQKLQDLIDNRTEFENLIIS